MTNIQAIDLLKDLEQRLDDYCELNDEGKTAFRMAITALEVFGNSEQLPSAQPYTEDEIQKIQDLEQAQLDKMYELGKQTARPEIVRCKDCEWFRKEYGWNCIEYTVCGISPTHHPIRREDDFCSYAERRTDADMRGEQDG